VEDIEAVDLDDLEQRELGGYEPLEEITQARSSVSQLPDSSGAQPLPGPASSRAPGSSRGAGSSRAPGSSRGPGSRGPSASRAPGSSRAPGTGARNAKSAKPRAASRSSVPEQVSRSSVPEQVTTRALAPSTRPEPPEYKLPPPPLPRLPVPMPKQSTPPARYDELRQPFPSEPGTRPRSEPPPPPDELDDDPTATPLAIPARLRAKTRAALTEPELERPEIREPPPSMAPAPARYSSLSPRDPTVPPPISSAAPAELEAAVMSLSETPPPVGVQPSLDVAFLAACRGLEDLPPETQSGLAAIAGVETLAAEQEVSGFGLALVIRGSVLVMPTIAEGACGRAVKGEPVFSRGTLAQGVSLRVVAEAEGADVAVWLPEDIEQVLVTCPWVADELRAVADRYQALAGAAMGTLGERLDDTMRSMLTDRCELKVLLEGDVLIEAGKAPDGLYIVGGGSLELVAGGAVQGTLGPGDVPFASAVLTHEKANATVRAAASGALVLHADRMTTHELIVSLPPLLELLSMS